jgi:hypothetical protein
LAASYRVLIAGSEVDGWESLDFQDTIDLALTNATITFPDSSTLLASQGVGQDIQIQRDKQNIWRGLGVAYSKIYGSDGRKQYNLNCQSNKVYLEREAFSKGGKYTVAYGGSTSTATNPNPYSTFATDIVQDILNSQNTPVLTKGIFGSTNIPHIAFMVTRLKALAVLTEIVAASLWEARFNPDNTLDFQPQVGATSPIYAFDENRNILKGESDYGVDKLINNVIICGAGTATGTAGGITDNQIVATAQNSSSITTNGRFSKIFNFPNVADANLLQAYANACVNDLSQPVYTYKSNVLILESGVPFKVGDTVIVRNPSFGLNGTNFRVASFQVHYDAKGWEDFNVVLAQNLRQVNITHFKVKALEQVLNNWQVNQQTIANSLQTSTSGTLPLNVSTTQSYSGNQATPVDADYFLSNAVTGIDNGLTATLKWQITTTSGSPGYSNFYVKNSKTGTTYSTNVNGSPVTTTDDIFSVPIEFHVHASVASGGFSFNFYMEVDLPSPTIPQ